QRVLVCRQKSWRPGQTGEGCPFEATPAEVISGVTVVVDKGVHVHRQLQSRSHSFGSFGVSPLRIMLIFPSLVMSIRTLSTPAARAARMARVMSDCRNVAGARLIATTVKTSLLPARPAPERPPVLLFQSTPPPPLHAGPAATQSRWGPVLSSDPARH